MLDAWRHDGAGREAVEVDLHPFRGLRADTGRGRTLRLFETARRGGTRTRRAVTGALCGALTGRPARATLDAMSKRSQFDQFEVSELFCPRCRAAKPVRRHLLLVLPTGNTYEYRCSACGTAVGAKDDNDSSEFTEILRRT